MVGGAVLRATRLDGCGRPVYGDCSQVVSDSFVSITATANVDDGDEINVKKANGKTCVQKTPCPILNGYSVEIEFCGVDPDLFGMLTGQESVIDPFTGDAIGFDVDGDISACDSGFALEIWSEVPGLVCDENSEGQWGYILFPFLQGGVFGDFTIENDAVSFTMTGATTKRGSTWGTGPYNVARDALGAPGKLATPVNPGTFLRTFLTDVAPPEPVCGCFPLDNPASPAATGATAGDPGSFTPVPSNRPDNLAAMAGITASPATAWTTGQHVVLEDGSHAYWTGTAWAEGEAP